MELTIHHQERYSRGELLLRNFFGFFYILLPHAFVLMFVGLWSLILRFIAFWLILFTGRYPQSFFEFQVGLIKWNVRVLTRYYNISDGYPAFGIDAKDEFSDFTMPYPERISRGLTLVRALFGWLYVLIPHGIILMFLSFAAAIVSFVAFWVVLFTGEFPKSMHEFIVGTLRWNLRVKVYLMHMTDEYPPFSMD